MLLLVTFRSVVLPLKAVLMNLLSLGATYGVLVLVFQEGWGNEILGAEQGPVQNFVPVLLLALLFSLSTDYEVFLLGRVSEEFRRTGDNEASVAEGLTRTAPLISGAALLMVAVFGAFAFTASARNSADALNTCSRNWSGGVSDATSNSHRSSSSLASP